MKWSETIRIGSGAASSASLALAVLFLAGCSRSGKVEYVEMKAVPGTVEVSYAAPKAWNRVLNGAGTASDSWEVELVHPENRLVNIDIRKYALSKRTKGYPVLTAEELVEQTRRLPRTEVGPVEPLDTPNLKMRKYAYEGDYLQVSGAQAPRMKGINAFFESNGFLYVINYAVPVEDFEANRPIFEHIIETLKLSPA